MKKLFLLVLVISLVSCRKVPQDSVDTAHNCIDSLKSLGAENSIKFSELQKKLADADARLEHEKAMLFKKFGLVRIDYEEVIEEARHFEMTNDRPTKSNEVISINTNPNSIKLEVQIDFDRPQDALEIATQIDESIRRTLNSKAKLIRVNIVK